MFPRFQRIPKQPLKERFKNIKTALNDKRRGRTLSIEEFEKRMSICRDCEFYHKYATTCNICGCFMKVKAASPSMKCPIDKWLPSDFGIQGSNKDK